MSKMPRYKEEAHVLFGKLAGFDCIPDVKGDFVHFDAEAMKKLPPNMFIEIAMLDKRTKSELASLVRQYRSQEPK